MRNVAATGDEHGSASESALRAVIELPPLVEAKLMAPRLRSGMVLRPRLVADIEAGGEAALTLVLAPAGYGKTTAVRACFARAGAALAWVTLDSNDNDPVRLWTYVATAVDRVRDGLGRRAVKRLRAPGLEIEVPVDELMNGIASFGREFVIVLDDADTVTDRECLATIDYAIGHLPPRAHLIVISRADPALDLSRIRAGGGLVEVRASDLAFTTEEARELLVDRAGLDLEAGDLEILMRRTEGWPAVVYLAALWLRTVDDQQLAIREFGGDQRYVAEFLSRQVLASLDDDKRSFLLRAAVLGRMTVELCDAVLGRTDSASMLAELEHANLFVLPLERKEWFRVHPMFAEFAAADLGSDDPGAVPEIHRSAAGWFRARGLVVEAIEHAAVAGDHEVVAELLSETHLALIRLGRPRTLLRWAQTLPDEILIGHPELIGAAATAASMLGGLTRERRRFFRLADRAKSERPDSFTAYADAVVSMARAAAVDDGVANAVLEGRRAVKLAYDGADEVLVAALAALSRALYLQGELDEAWMRGSRAAEHPDAPRRPPGYALALSTLALVAAERGRLTTARRYAEMARGIVGGITISRSWIGVNAAVAIGAVSAGEGDLASAEREFASAERYFRDEVPNVHHARLLVRLAEVRCRRGRLDEADATLREANDILVDLGDSGRVPSLAVEVGTMLQEARCRACSHEILEPPTEAELAVLHLLATDLSAREIAGELFLSPNTVKSHVRGIYRKLGVRSRDDAVARATALGLSRETRSPG